MTDRRSDSFCAIDFETATFHRSSACAVGLIVVEQGEITDEYYTLIRPPENVYYRKCIDVHGILPEDTEEALPFPEVYPEIRSRLAGRTVVAHNERFDRGVLDASLSHYGIQAPELHLETSWECTLKIYRAKGYRPADLGACCRRQGIALDHHQALSDARGCALLYLKR